jgi:pimeloyl-ACP methyl ester carboxylesterase
LARHFLSIDMRQNISDKALEKFFRENNIPGVIHHYTKANRRIRYITIGENKPATLFSLHGSPASLMAEQDFFTDHRLLQTFQWIAVDRPGYGRSGYGKPEPSIKRQAELLVPIITELTSVKRPLILLGASYGASVACRMVMDHPGVADGMLLYGPSMAPGEEKMFWLTPLIERSFIRRIIPPHHRTSNTEKIQHKKDLQKMLPYWKDIRIPVVYIQGEKDEMIYTSNAQFAKENLINVPKLEIVMIPKQKHNLKKENLPIVKAKILQLYKELTIAG